MSDKTAERRPLDLILFIVSLGGFLLILVTSGMIVIENLLSGPSGVDTGLNYSITTALSITFVGICALPTCIMSARALIGQSPFPPRPGSSIWLVSIVLLPLTLILGHLAFTRGLFSDLIGPPAHILTALVPALIAIVLIRRHGPTYSPRRTWGQFLVGLWAIPITSLILEILTLIPTMIAIAVLLMSTAGGRQLIGILTNPDHWLESQIYETLFQILRQPGVLMVILGYVVIIVPLIEEAAKTMAVWPFLRRGLRPASAFIGGAIGGAAYGLFEALFLTQPGPSWTTNMIARIGATVMHSFTAGLSSWGLAQVVGNREWKRFGRAYLGAVLMHALWNAIALGISFNSIAVEYQYINLTPSMLAMINLSGVILLTLLSSLALIGLIRMPRRLMREQIDSMVEVVQQSSREP
ncbi:MAG: hypothetical protein AMJ88_10115 [Anaerolineae bacterium SM23_ 63]|nr:MAG: hypothetical protein AMJ88_10115 [Anaerolineae bacterium SM23_ 63]HEY46233.1 PrsW family intramembrane metalloprotease [Anaerolineae bacterium]